MKNNITIMFILAFFLIGSFAANGQENTVTGTVFSETGEPLPGANVVVRGTTTGVATDKDGKFSIVVPEGGKIVVSYIGHQTKTVDVGLQKDLRIELSSSIQLDAFIVTASRKKELLIDAPVSIEIITAKAIEDDVVTHPTQSLRYLTGVDVIDNGGGYPIANLRGVANSFQQETYVLIDNRSIFTPGFREIAIARTPIDAIDIARVEVVKGAASALYGPGVETGLIHYITKDPFDYPGTTVSVYGGEQNSKGVSLRHAGVVNNKFGYKVTGFYRGGTGFPFLESDPDDAVIIDRILGAVRPAGKVNGKNYIVNGEDTSIPTDIEVLDYTIKSFSSNGLLKYKFNPRTHLSLYGGLTFSENTSSRTATIDHSKFPSHYASMNFTSGDFFVQYNWLRSSNKHQRGTLTGGVTSYHVGNQHDIQAVKNWYDIIPSLNIALGADYRHTFVDSRNTIYVTTEGDDDLWNAGIYTQADYNLTDNLEINGAVRYDYLSFKGIADFSPRLALIYKPAKKHTIRLTYNRAVGIIDNVGAYFQGIDGTLGAYPGEIDTYLRVWGLDNGLTWEDGVRVYDRLQGGKGNHNDAEKISLQDLVDRALGGTDGEKRVKDNGDNSLSDAEFEKLKSLQVDGTTPITLIPLGASSPVTKESYYKQADIVRPVTNMFELGYQGIIGDKLSVTADLYYMIRNDFNPEPAFVTPIAYVNNAEKDLTQAFIDVGQSNDEAAKLASAVAAEYSSFLGLGIISVEESAELLKVGNQTHASAVLPFTAIKEVSYYGLDFGLKYRDVIPGLTILGNYSILSDNEFDVVLQNNPDFKRTYHLNQGIHKVKFAVNYGKEKGLSFNLGYIFKSGYQGPVQPANVQRDISAYTTVDAGVGYTFNFGLGVKITASNLLDSNHRVLPQYPRTGRLVLGRLTYNLPFGKKK